MSCGGRLVIPRHRSRRIEICIQSPTLHATEAYPVIYGSTEDTANLNRISGRLDMSVIHLNAIEGFSGVDFSHREYPVIGPILCILAVL